MPTWALTRRATERPDVLRFLLDTNTLCDAYKGAGRCRERLVAHPATACAISAITLMELMAGSAKAGHPVALRTFITSVSDRYAVLPFDAAVASHAAEVRHILAQAGTPIGPYDTLIAATGRAHGLVVATRNAREFGRVPGLQVENWFD